MKRTPERIEALAAEYVLGSLHGAARRRFERWMMESVRVRQEVWFWEEKLGHLGARIEEEQPPASVWAGIERRLWPREDKSVPAVAANDAPGRWFWPGWSMLATAAALVLAVVLVQQPEPQMDGRLSGAIVKADVSDPLWLVSESSLDRQLKLRPVAATAAQQGKDYELWIVPENGQPLSLGVIPVGGTYQVTLDDEARALLSNSRTLAISLEPVGGSPTGQPTGPILHVAKLYEL
ncbi:anti-sigma factor [Marinobacter salarius]|jgi:anti-sigma-K factor RskA|uniref:anti-sigma factor n=1 Tax=Marinobacter salarius TaxID=1420917 RepID=UPI0018F1EE10|nr:anti-sigma factor [Marinobacter salarius]MBJ7278422.1 anti-sigma factor [Marinobacter salarius]